MIAALGMYDRPEAQASNDALWRLIRDGLRAAGLPAPDALTRGDAAYGAGWTAPDLILSQTCGFPYRARLHGHVTLIGTPDHGLPGCPPGHYRSLFIARADDTRASVAEFADARFAYNDGLSQSGWAAPSTYAARLGFALTPALQTGGHALSARAVAEGRADLATVDAVAWAMMTRYDPVTEGLRVVAQTVPTPGLPYIAAAGHNGALLFEVIAAAIAALPARHRDILHLRGLVRIAPEAYLAVPTPRAPDQFAQG